MNINNVNPLIRDRVRARWQDIVDAQHVVTRCADCRWYYRGLMRDARAAFRSHRELKHNERRSA